MWLPTPAHLTGANRGSPLIAATAGYGRLQSFPQPADLHFWVLNALGPEGMQGVACLGFE